VLTLLVLRLVSLPRLLATLVSPTMLGALLVLDLVVLVWRLAAVAQAFFDRRFALPPGRFGLAGLVFLAAFVAVPHLIAVQYDLAAQHAFGRIFAPQGVAGSTGQPQPTIAPLDPSQRINVLLIGIDKTPKRPATLTDTMMVASLDPAGRTASLVSVPRDMVNVPLGNGSTYGPKINSLYQYAQTHPSEFPGGGRRALADALGALLGIRIQYTATIDFVGFMKVIDAVGGVDVTVARGFNDPTYDGYGIGSRGFSITGGPHHLDGPQALAFARSRKAAGESDFTRQDRQQQILVALKDKVARGGSLLFSLPSLLDALGETISTDFPIGELPSVAAVVDEMGKSAITRVVIRAPLVRAGVNRYGDVEIPNLAAIRAMAAGVFSTPGTPPTPWPTPKPTRSPAASAAP
jgi:LCP family protein required for cell wall assembly